MTAANRTSPGSYLSSLVLAVLAAVAGTGCGGVRVTTPVTTVAPGRSSDDTAASTAPATSDASKTLVSEPWLDDSGQVSMDINPEWPAVESDAVNQDSILGAWVVGDEVDGATPIAMVAVVPKRDLGDDPLASFVEAEEDDYADFTLIDSGTLDGEGGQELYFAEWTGILGDRTVTRHTRRTYAVGESTIVWVSLVTATQAWDDVAPGVVPYFDTVRNLS